MTEQQACTLCGAGGHTAAQCNKDDNAPVDACDWLESLEGDAWADACEEIAASVQKMRQQADDEKVEREAFEAHESKERRLSPADQQFWFRRGAIADYDLKSIDDAWKAWKARAALAQACHQCAKCGGTGDADSGGIHPWGEAAMVPCDCAHTEGAQGELWAVHAQGPDDLYAAFSREDAEKHAADLNALPMPEGISVGAVVIPSPWLAAEHWKYLAEQEREHKDAIEGQRRNLAATLLSQNHELMEARAALAQPSPAPELERPEVVTHSDDAAVDRFSASMKQKLEAARAKGRSGWDDPSCCDVALLAERLIEHLGKGNAGTFEDVANFAMMLHQRGAHPQVLAEAAGAIERDYLRIIQAQEEKWSGRFEVLEDEAKTLRRERDAAQARVAELEKQEPEFWYRDDGDGGVEFTSPCDGFARPLYAAPVAQAGQVPEGYALMPKTLTAENGAKGIFLGEFREHAKIRCQCIDSDGDADDYCELCHGDGSYLQPVAVRWETIKAIYATAVDKLAAAPQPAKGE